MCVYRPLQPVHQVTLPAEYLGVVLGDLASSRRAHVQEVGEDVEEERVVSALAPLACLAVRKPFGQILLVRMAQLIREAQ